MAIFAKTGASVWSEVTQPYIKLTTSTWTPLKRVLTKVAAGWVEVWPSKIVYIHYNYGYNLNMHQLFGSPTGPAEYVFINKGWIGGSVNGGAGDIALDTGVFPAGSRLTFINEGYVSGSGGDGSSFTSSGPPGNPRYATPGGDGLRLRFPLIIDNTAGFIQGGGGGGGTVGDFGGKTRHNRGGGGGAGLPGGRARIDTWGGNEAVAGSLDSGGAGNIGGDGGAPGAWGVWPSNRINDDYDIRTQGAGPGLAIKYTGYIQAGSSGLTADRVKGKQLPGLNGAGCVQMDFFGAGKNVIGNGTNYGNWGANLLVNVRAEGSGAVVTAARIGGASTITVTKLSATQFAFKTTSAATKSRSPQSFESATIRFTLTSASGNDSFDMVVYCGRPWTPPNQHRSCFPAGSLVTMADGSVKAIELVQPGEYIKTAVGVSRVSDIDYPILGDRPMYEFPGGKCRTSGEHSMWSRKPGTDYQWWATRDMDQWEIEALSGDGPNFDTRPFDLSEMEGQEWEFATEKGWVRTTWSRVDAEPETQLYHLLLEEGGSYYVDGYLVSSMADSGGVVWENFKHR